MDTLYYAFWDNMTHYKTKSVHFGGLMNSATKRPKVMTTYSGNAMLAKQAEAEAWHSSHSRE